LKTRVEIKEYSKALIQSNYWMKVAVIVIYGAILSGVSMATMGIGALIIAGPMLIGFNYFFLLSYRGESPDIGVMFNNGFKKFGRNLGGYLWMVLFIYLWSLLFIIPGIIKSFSYAMTPYILADSQNVKAQDALKISMRMMDGHKLDLFVFYLSFLGWMLLSGITFGLVGLFYAGPYMGTSVAGFYEELKISS
jgi:uncharacterized membrane protein